MPKTTTTWNFIINQETRVQYSCLIICGILTTLDCTMLKHLYNMTKYFKFLLVFSLYSSFPCKTNKNEFLLNLYTSSLSNRLAPVIRQ